MHSGKYLGLFALFIIFLSCGQQEVKHTGNTVAWQNLLDTNNAEHTYQNLKAANEQQVDSAYITLTTVLTGRGRFELLFDHLAYYKKLANDSKMYQALYARVQGTQYEIKSKYDSAQSSLERSIKLYQELKLPAEQSKAYFMLATNYLYQGDNANALKNMYSSLEIAEKNRDTAKAYIIRTEMVTLYNNQMDYNRGIEMAMENRDYFQARIGDPESKYLLKYNEVNLALAYYRKKDYNKALEYGHSALNASREMGDSLGVAHCLNNISLSLVALGRCSEAIPLLTEAHSLQKQSKDRRQELSTKQNLAHCLAQAGKTEQAKQMLLETAQEAEARGQNQAKISAYAELSAIYDVQGNYKEALHYHHLYKKYSDSLYNSDNNKIIKDLNIKYETHKKEAQIKTLEAERKLDSLKKTTYILVLALTIIISVLAILFLRNRNRKNELLIEKVQRELDANKKELSQFTENIIAKNNLIEELENKLVTSASEPVAEQENSEQLSELYQFKILTENDWSQFKILFDKVYPGLITRLREQYPLMAPAEERQFLLTRLNINNKESANMLGISLEGVKKNRYRLKKRFELTETEDMDEFVKSF